MSLRVGLDEIRYVEEDWLLMFYVIHNKALDKQQIQ